MTMQRRPIMFRRHTTVTVMPSTIDDGPLKSNYCPVVPVSFSMPPLELTLTAISRVDRWSPINMSYCLFFNSDLAWRTYSSNNVSLRLIAVYHLVAFLERLTCFQISDLQITLYCVIIPPVFFSYRLSFLKINVLHILVVMGRSSNFHQCKIEVVSPPRMQT